jgi:hypothetical protein
MVCFLIFLCIPRYSIHLLSFKSINLLISFLVFEIKNVHELKSPLLFQPLLSAKHKATLLLLLLMSYQELVSHNGSRDLRG